MKNVTSIHSQKDERMQHAGDVLQLALEAVATSRHALIRPRVKEGKIKQRQSEGVARCAKQINRLIVAGRRLKNREQESMYKK